MKILKKKIVFAHCLIVLTVLYYFLRFQTGYVSEFAVLQVFLLTFAGILGFLFLIKDGIVSDKKSLLNSSDAIFLLIILHGILFSPFIFFRDGLYLFFYSCLHTILPFIIFYYFSRRFYYNEIANLIFFIELVFLFVAFIYISEFFSNIVFKTGSMDYAVALNDYVINQLGIEGGVSSSFVQGDRYVWIRMAGPLSHVNTTGLAIALGLILSFGRLYLMKIKIELPIFFIFLTALLMTGGRTSIVSGMLGLIFILILRHGFLYAFLKSLCLAFFASPFIILSLYFLVTYGLIDSSAFLQIYNIEQFSKTISVILDNVNFTIYLEQLVNNPLTLVTGLGYPSADISLIGWGSSFRDDDVFFLSLLSRYGVVIPALFIFLLINFGRSIRNQVIGSKSKDLEFIFMQIILLSFVIAALFSTVHTDALFRPQILPIVVMVISFLVAIQRGYK